MESGPKGKELYYTIQNLDPSGAIDFVAQLSAQGQKYPGEKVIADTKQLFTKAILEGDEDAVAQLQGTVNAGVIGFIVPHLLRGTEATPVHMVEGGARSARSLEDLLDLDGAHSRTVNLSGPQNSEFGPIELHRSTLGSKVHYVNTRAEFLAFIKTERGVGGLLYKDPDYRAMEAYAKEVA